MINTKIKRKLSLGGGKGSKYNLGETHSSRNVLFLNQGGMYMNVYFIINF